MFDHLMKKAMRGIPEGDFGLIKISPVTGAEEYDFTKRKTF